VRCWEALRSTRKEELLQLTTRIVELHESLFERPAEVSHTPEQAGALQEHTLASLRERLGDLEALEGERRTQAMQQQRRLEDLWDSLGLQIPEGLLPQEAALLQGIVPLSERRLHDLNIRQGELCLWQEQVRVEVDNLQQELDEWTERLSPFGLPGPETVPDDLPLLPRCECLKGAVQDVETVATDFVSTEWVAWDEFARAAQLRNILTAVEAIRAAADLPMQLKVFSEHWTRVCGQREEHRRISELIDSRTALERDIRDFDAETKDPNRFKRRGYNGVEESRRRAEYQRRLRMLDSSISVSKNDWQQGEGVPFCVHGSEYRGTELLPNERTHMYAWTSRDNRSSRSFDTEDVTPTRRGGSAVDSGSPPTETQEGHSQMTAACRRSSRSSHANLSPSEPRRRSTNHNSNRG